MSKKANVNILEIFENELNKALENRVLKIEIIKIMLKKAKDAKAGIVINFASGESLMVFPDEDIIWKHKNGHCDGMNIDIAADIVPEYIVNKLSDDGPWYDILTTNIKPEHKKK